MHHPKIFSGLMLLPIWVLLGEYYKNILSTEKAFSAIICFTFECKMPLNSDTTASIAESFQVSLATADLQLLTLILLHCLLGPFREWAICFFLLPLWSCCFLLYMYLSSSHSPDLDPNFLTGHTPLDFTPSQALDLHVLVFIPIMPSVLLSWWTHLLHKVTIVIVHFARALTPLSCESSSYGDLHRVSVSHDADI